MQYPGQHLNRGPQRCKKKVLTTKPLCCSFIGLGYFTIYVPIKLSDPVFFVIYSKLVRYILYPCFQYKSAEQPVVLMGVVVTQLCQARTLEWESRNLYLLLHIIFWIVTSIVQNCCSQYIGGSTFEKALPVSPLKSIYPF